MQLPIWMMPNGEVISCVEKLKVMEQNIAEFRQVAQDLFEDGILMDIDPEQLRAYLLTIIQNLKNPYQ